MIFFYKDSKSKKKKKFCGVRWGGGGRGLEGGRGARASDFFLLRIQI